MSHSLSQLSLQDLAHRFLDATLDRWGVDREKIQDVLTAVKKKGVKDEFANVLWSFRLHDKDLNATYNKLLTTYGDDLVSSILKDELSGQGEAAALSLWKNESYDPNGLGATGQGIKDGAQKLFSVFHEIGTSSAGDWMAANPVKAAVGGGTAFAGIVALALVGSGLVVVTGEGAGAVAVAAPVIAKTGAMIGKGIGFLGAVYGSWRAGAGVGHFYNAATAISPLERDHQLQLAGESVFEVALMYVPSGISKVSKILKTPERVSGLLSQAQKAEDAAIELFMRAKYHPTAQSYGRAVVAYREAAGLYKEAGDLAKAEELAAAAEEASTIVKARSIKRAPKPSLLATPASTTPAFNPADVEEGAEAAEEILRAAFGPPKSAVGGAKDAPALVKKAEACAATGLGLEGQDNKAAAQLFLQAATLYESAGMPSMATHYEWLAGKILETPACPVVN